jgi:hypothetical protein
MTAKSAWRHFLLNQGLSRRSATVPTDSAAQRQGHKKHRISNAEY